MRNIPDFRPCLAFFLAAALVGGCRNGARHAAAPETRIARLERTLEGERDAEALVADVEAWIARAGADALPADRERVELLSTDLRARLERVKPQLGRKSDQPAGGESLERDVADLSNAYDRAIASISTERRTAEEAMAKAAADLDDELKGFRVEVASAGVQGNAEVKSRLTELDLARREAADTLVDLRRAKVDTWPALHRRWQAQTRRWNENLQQANERLKNIPPPPAPAPTPKPTPKPAARPPKIPH